MAVHLTAIGLLALAFLLGTTRNINLGAIALVCGGVLVLLVTGDGPAELYAAFPADLFLLLVGVTFLFGIATVNGTIDWVVEALGRAVRGKASAMPWVLFLVSGVATSIGALAPAVVALVAPIGMKLAKRNNINRRLVGLMILHGAGCGNFSPLNLLGATVNKTLERAGLTPQPMTLFLANLGYNVLLGVVIYLAYGGVRLWRQERVEARLSASSYDVSEVTVPTSAATIPATSAATATATATATAPRLEGSPPATADGGESAGADEGDDVRGGTKLTPIRGVTLLVILAVGAIAMVGRVDIGILALSAAIFLRVVAPTSSVGAAKKIAWEVVLLIAGVVTYVGVLRSIGTIDFLGDAANNLDSVLLTAFVICLIGAVVSAFASSAAIIAVLIPLALPFLLSGDISPIGMVIAISISATVVDATPFSTIGALVLSNADADDRPYVYRGSLQWGAIMVLTAPVITMAFILPSVW
ncbi:SLC13 family permease [Streptomyces sp. NPDC055105]|uniref:SLC13 family permease n=1 Tax=Streptomyces sp. NPDC055105 TaxID=3365719 RepID=UPI0037CE65EC